MFVIHTKNQPLDISCLVALPTCISKIIQVTLFYSTIASRDNNITDDIIRKVISL